jgi:hypothetical protein
MKTLLERAKGSALDITIDLGTPPDTMILLSSKVQQIRHLTFPLNCWMDVLKFSEAISGPLPLLRTIKIWTIDNLRNQPDMLTTPSPPPLQWCNPSPGIRLYTQVGHTLEPICLPRTHFTQTVDPRTKRVQCFRPL